MKNKNSIIIITITTVVLWIVEFKGTIFVFNNPDFHYNGLPLWEVYCILAMYLVIAVMGTVLAVMKFIIHGKYGKYGKELQLQITMKHFERALLLVIALAVGGGLGYKLLPDFEPVKMIIFAICCLILGEIFYRIDKKLSQK